MKNIKTKFFLEKCLKGLNFIVIGLHCYYTFVLNRDFDVVRLLFFILIIGSLILDSVVLPKLQFEPVDEMTKVHEQRAQAATYNAICVTLALLGVVCMISRKLRNMFLALPLNWSYLFIVLGLLQMAEYIYFLKIEKSGDMID